MISHLGVIVAKADAQGKLLESQELREASGFYGTFSARSEAAKEIAKNSYNLAEGAIQSIYRKFPYIPITSLKGEIEKLTQDIQDWLRYISYCLILGNTSYLDENLVPGLFEVLKLYNLSPSWYVAFLLFFRENHGFSGVSANETNVYINYLINILGGSAKYTEEYKNTYQFISTQVHLNTSDSAKIEQVKAALLNFFNAFDFEIEIDFPEKAGSWFKRFLLRTKEVISDSEFQDRIKKIERTIELKSLQLTQSEIDKNQAEAVSKVLDSLSKIEDGGVFLIGSILMIKRKGEPVIVNTLTPEQMIYLQKNPGSMNNPDRVIEILSQALLSEDDQITYLPASKKSTD